MRHAALLLVLALAACATAPPGSIDPSADRLLGVACDSRARVLRAEMLTAVLERRHPDLNSRGLRDALSLMMRALTPDEMDSAASAYRWALVAYSREVFARSDTMRIVTVEGLERISRGSPALRRDLETIRRRITKVCST